jgi:hypothetical protein
MKVMVEISDEMVIATLREAVERALKCCRPTQLPMQYHEAVDLADALSLMRAANHVIEHFGGEPVSIDAVYR